MSLLHPTARVFLVSDLYYNLQMDFCPVNRERRNNLQVSSISRLFLQCDTKHHDSSQHGYGTTGTVSRITIFRSRISNAFISATPVLNDVKNVTLARNTRNNLVALVSYENKVRIPILGTAGFESNLYKGSPSIMETRNCKGRR